MTSPQPTEDQLLFLQTFGEPFEYGTGIRNPAGVRDLLADVRDKRAQLIGTNVVYDCTDVVMEAVAAHPETVQGNIINGRLIDPALFTKKVVGSLIVDRWVMPNKAISSPVVAPIALVEGEAMTERRLDLSATEAFRRSTYDTAFRELRFSGQTAKLTPNEAAIFSVLVSRTGEVVTRQTLSAAVQTSVRTIESTISTLRTKLRGVGLCDDAIETLRGEGFFIRQSPALSQRKAS